MARSRAFVRSLAARSTRALLVGALALPVAGAVAAGLESPAYADTYSMESQFVADINAARAAKGLPAYSVAGDLTSNARAHSAAMARSQTLYDDPNVGNEVCCWMSIGENSGYGPDVNTINQAFLNSPPHYANMVDASFTQVGVGVVVSNGTVWVTEVFRQPVGSAPKPPAPVVSHPSVPAAPVSTTPPSAPVSSGPAAPVRTGAPAPAATHHASAPRPSPTATLAARLATVRAHLGHAAHDPFAQALSFESVMLTLTH